MNKLSLSIAALVFGASSAMAGGLDAPVIEMQPVEIIEDTGGSSSNAGLIIPLILVALIAVAVSSDD